MGVFLSKLSPWFQPWVTERLREAGFPYEFIPTALDDYRKLGRFCGLSESEIDSMTPPELLTCAMHYAEKFRADESRLLATPSHTNDPRTESETPAGQGEQPPKKLRGRKQIYPDDHKRKVVELRELHKGKWWKEIALMLREELIGDYKRQEPSPTSDQVSEFTEKIRELVNAGYTERCYRAAKQSERDSLSKRP